MYAHPADAVASRISGAIHGSTLDVTGSSGRDNIGVSLRGTDPNVLEVIDVAHPTTVLAFSRSDFTSLHVAALGGDDTVSIIQSGGVFTTVIPTTLDGGDGNDTLRGGEGAETFLGCRQSRFRAASSAWTRSRSIPAWARTT